MLPVFSSIRAKAQMSVTMNGLLVGLDRCAENLQRFCRPVAFYNDGYAHELSLAGSSFLFRHRGRHLLLCCRHQMTNHERQPNELVIIVETGKGGHVALTPNEVSQAITELPPHQLAELQRFFQEYKAFEGKVTEVDEFYNQARAVSVIREAIEHYKRRLAERGRESIA